jgi:hypothetical protein
VTDRPPTPFPGEDAGVEAGGPWEDHESVAGDAGEVRLLQDIEGAGSLAVLRRGRACC